MRLSGRIKFWLHTRCPGFVGAFQYFGSRVYFPPDSFLFRLVCDSGIYEHQTLKIIASRITPGSYYFDVGANIGLMAVPILDLVKDCKIVSFEPSPGVLPYLVKTQAGSPMRDRWKVIPKAVSDSVRQSGFSFHGPELSAFDGLESTGRYQSEGEVTVEVTTLDTEWVDLGRPVVSLIKCDVEGGELAVLKGARQCIIKSRPVIVIEWNKENFESYNHCPADLLSLAEELDCYVISSASGAIITRACELEISNAVGMEVFVLFPK